MSSKRTRTKLRVVRRREEKSSIAEAEARIDQELEDAETAINAALAVLDSRLGAVESAM